MRPWIPVAAVAALLLAAPGCGGSAQKDTTGDGGRKAATLMLNWVPYGEHAPFYYGLKKGFYTEAGIDLKIQPGGGSGKTIQQVAQRNTDFGWADTAVLLKSVGSGMPVKSLGAYLQKGPNSVEFFADKGFTSPKDLKGKSIGGTPGDAPYTILPAWLASNGLAATDVKMVNVDAAGKIAALIEGKVDAIVGFAHDQAPTIEKTSGKKVNVLLYADWGMNLLGTGPVVAEPTLQKDPDLVRKFLKATQRSWTEAAKNQAEAVAAMVEMAEQEPPAEVLTKQLALTVGLLQLDQVSTPGTNTEAQWKQTIDLMAKYAELPSPGAPDKYWAKV